MKSFNRFNFNYTFIWVPFCRYMDVLILNMYSLLGYGPK